MAVEIKIADLRLVINRILNHIEHDLGRKEVVLDEDDYWDVGTQERYDFTKSPAFLELGKLSDDWEFLSAILNDKDQAFALMLLHATPLIRRIGEQVRE
ncbi:MAG: hypothetical protein DI563_11450 [Variovorax paradoxus]|uniref:Uncharacterized protein n=1 Tax=Variovorax paradoxus TaxID=34073 RepID=A0A2W5Q8V9_VARPD|nr:MAG: hypothetical protein DI563_11450 [Variovorax paradoxus]